MKVIFLDVDGVLNCREWFERTTGLSGHWDIDYTKVQRLKQIVDATGAKIVLTSTWRGFEYRRENDKPMHPKYKYLVDSLAIYGMEIMDFVPYHDYVRPLEISEWLHDHAMEVESFVSLDDDYRPERYKEYDIEHCLVRTSFYGEIDPITGYAVSESGGGLQDCHVEKAIRILNGGD